MMLKSCFPYLGSPKCVENDKESIRSNEMELRQNNNNLEPSLESSRSRAVQSSSRIMVRVVHAGGRVEHYPNAVLASKLLEKLPAGKWLTHPQVFKQPHESVLGPDEYLLPGHKYYVVPLSTINKLKKKYANIPATPNYDRNNMTKHDVGQDQEDITSDVSSVVEDADYRSRELFINIYETAKKSTSTSTPTRRNGNGSRKSGRISTSHLKPKNCSGYNWEPGLTSIKELSP